jgi:hypothetical protein
MVHRRTSLQLLQLKSVCMCYVHEIEACVIPSVHSPGVVSDVRVRVMSSFTCFPLTCSRLFSTRWLFSRWCWLRVVRLWWFCPHRPDVLRIPWFLGHHHWPRRVLAEHVDIVHRLEDSSQRLSTYPQHGLVHINLNTRSRSLAEITVNTVTLACCFLDF